GAVWAGPAAGRRRAGEAPRPGAGARAAPPPPPAPPPGAVPGPAAASRPAVKPQSSSESATPRAAATPRPAVSPEAPAAPRPRRPDTPARRPERPSVPARRRAKPPIALYAGIGVGFLLLGGGVAFFLIGAGALCRRGSGAKAGIESIEPPRARSGQTVVLGGQGFDPEPNANVVLFGDKPGTVVDGGDSRLEVRVPPMAVTPGQDAKVAVRV